MVFEAESRSPTPVPGATTASPLRPAAVGDGGFQPVFENDILPPLPPSQSQTAGAGGGKVPLWDNGGFGFSDILDIINPLQHLPIISTIYRAETGDKIGAIPRILGSMLYGGGLIGAAVGAATAVANLVVQQETGKDIGGLIYTAIFGEGGKNAKSTTIATNPAPPAATAKAAPAAAAAASTASAMPQNLLAAPRPASTSAAIRPAPAKAKPAALAPAPTTARLVPAPAAQASPPVGGIRVTGKDAPPTSLAVAAGKAVSSQFRRSTWYRRNQDMLTAQAIELARAKAAAQARAAKKATNASAAGPQTKTVTGKPDMLGLFAVKSAAGGSGVAGSKSKSTINRPAPIPKAAMAGEMSKALAKYEQLLKSRIAAGAQTNQIR